MQTSDILTRVSGGVMMMAAAWNMFYAFMVFWIAIWACVGLWWVIPFMLAVVEFFVGLAMVVLGHNFRPIAFSPFLGLIVSALNFNLFALFMDAVAIGLGIGGFVTYDAELNEE